MFGADDPNRAKRAREANLLGLALDFAKQGEAILRRVEQTDDLAEAQQQLASASEKIDARRREFIHG